MLSWDLFVVNLVGICGFPDYYFIIMKKLSEIDWKLDWLSNFKYGNWIKPKILDWLNYWKLTNSLFLYFGLFSIWIFSNINIFFMQKVLESLNNFSS